MNLGGNGAKKAWHVTCVRSPAFNKTNHKFVYMIVNNMKPASHIKAAHA